MDSNDVLYISDTGNYRVLKYLPSATSGIPVAGIGTTGNALNQLGSAILFLMLIQIKMFMSVITAIIELCVGQMVHLLG